MHEGVLHIRDVEGPKKTGSVEARLKAMDQQVFKCQGMVELGLNANHMMITEFTNKHKIDANDIGKHLSRLYDRIDHLQAQIYDLQNQNSELHASSPDEEPHTSSHSHLLHDAGSKSARSGTKNACRGCPRPSGRKCDARMIPRLDDDCWGYGALRDWVPETPTMLDQGQSVSAARWRRQGGS
ncbi:40s ribosomal protein s5-1 [Hordeum vulgare]|nr:40s ribosomal protein s5-1 [Hordeum vulgare]